MRKDPPFDSEYFYATHLLSRPSATARACFNSPRGAARPSREARDPRVPAVHRADARHARRPRTMRAFHAEHRDIILKPLDGMGGMGIFRVGDDGLNLGSIVETLNRDGAHDGDGADATCPRSSTATSACWSSTASRCRIRWRASRRAARSAATSRPAARAWRADHRRATARSPRRIGPKLAARGLLLIGLDVIGDMPHRDQRHQPDLLPGDHRPDRLRRRRRCSSTRSRPRVDRATPTYDRRP